MLTSSSSSEFVYEFILVKGIYLSPGTWHSLPKGYFTVPLDCKFFLQFCHVAEVAIIH